MNDKDRKKTRVASYLIGARGNSVLLGKRKNAVHMNGYWSLIAGHVREEEASSNAMIREFAEECGVTLQPHELELVGAMHHLSPPFDYINFIFYADLTHHNPINLEEHKCEELSFHPVDNLPTPIDPYIAAIIQNSIPKKERWIMEYGWQVNR